MRIVGMLQSTLSLDLRRITFAESVEWQVTGLTTANMNWRLEEWLSKWQYHATSANNTIPTIVISMAVKTKHVNAMDASL